MKIEIFITAYNNPEYLADCVKSLLEQTFTDFGVLIIDDCSPEEMLPSIIPLIENDTRFNFVRRSTNVGGPIAFMEAVMKSRAEYVMWLHHDDWLHDSFLTKAFHALEEYKDSTFAYALCSRVIDGIPRNEFPTSIRPNLISGVYTLPYDMVINCWVMWSSALIRLKSYQQIGGLESLYSRISNRRIRSIYRYGESDLFTFARLSIIGSVCVINERLCFYRDHSMSNTQSDLLRATHIQDNVRTYDYIFDDINFFPEDVRLVSKINSVGRLSTNLGLSMAAEHLLYHSLLGRECNISRRDLVSKLRVSMERFIIDNEAYGYPRFFNDDELARLDNLIQIEPYP
jgi:glycosyltransferase involved in cell wall biosynthesis